MFRIHSLSQKQCLTCFNLKKQGLLEKFFIEDPVCTLCRKEMQAKWRKVKIGEITIYYGYVYEGIVRTRIILYKERFDELLHWVFGHPFRMRLLLYYSDYFIVKVPSTKESLQRREFDHMGLICDTIGLPVLNDVLIKKSSPKQSTLNFEQRAQVSQYFHIQNTEQIEGKKVLLMDDVLTSGASIKACKALLQPWTKCIKVFVLCIHPSTLHS